ERPYNGQPHTDQGERGRTEVKGLTMRDIQDCFVKAVLDSAPTETTESDEEFFKCFKLNKTSGEMEPTDYLKEKQNEPGYVSHKVELGTWRYQDVYKVDLNNIDMLAVGKNLTINIEKMMGIYPNVPKLNFTDETKIP
ncbi:MAG: hypothetical protein ACOC2U_03785, partial [bacterium]